MSLRYLTTALPDIEMISNKKSSDYSIFSGTTYCVRWPTASSKASRMLKLR